MESQVAEARDQPYALAGMWAQDREYQNVKTRSSKDRLPTTVRLIGRRLVDVATRNECISEPTSGPPTSPTAGK